MSDFAATKSLFQIPNGMVYLDGNSLGARPLATSPRLETTLSDEWGDMLITGWNRAGWNDKPGNVGNRIAKLIGAQQGHVVMGDTLSIKIYQALAAAIKMNPDRRVILSDNGNFPSDLYIAQGLIGLLDQGYELRVVDPQDVADNITDDIAVTLITEVDYRTGRIHDMKALTAKAHSVGAVTIWDLAHSAGAIPVDLVGANVDFAAGCTYKYLNGGPGAPAFIYVAPRHVDHVEPALSGWLGHEAPFAFDPDYRPGFGIERMRVGTPPVLQLVALETALDIWDMVDMDDVRAKSMQLTDLFINEIEARCDMVTLASPRDAAKRGSQVSFAFEDGYAAMQAFIARGVIGDFRAPNIMRFGFTPLYIDAVDVMKAADIIGDVMNNRLWDAPEYKVRNAVT